MKVSKEKVAEHRAHILDAAGRLFRERGFDAVTVAEIMKAAGLTHGAFYGYFPSKEALVAEAVGTALTPSAAAPSSAWIAAYADSYLSAEHRDNRDDCCMFSAVGTEAARGSPELRQVMTQSTRRQLDRFTAAAEGDSAQDKRRAAIVTWSAMVGAMVLARIVDDPALSDEILTQTRAALPLA
ncbi:MAG: TetR family transcriptional regulator [Rhodopseudomonas sp.]|nr:TetR family transcriptional regulator [Rhodopseudomonas sp.]